MRLQASKNGKVVVYRIPEGTSETEKKALEKEARLLAGYKPVDKSADKKRNFYRNYKRNIYQSKLFK